MPPSVLWRLQNYTGTQVLDASFPGPPELPGGLPTATAVGATAAPRVAGGGGRAGRGGRSGPGRADRAPRAGGRLLTRCPQMGSHKSATMRNSCTNRRYSASSCSAGMRTISPAAAPLLAPPFSFPLPPPPPPPHLPPIPP